MGNASYVFKGSMGIIGEMVEGDHVVHCFEPAMPTHGIDALVNTS